MNLELKTLIYSMLNNLVISVIKIVGGFIFNLSSLLADGMHTFSDFITDIVCLIGSRISKKKPTKYHPFGFGKVEYLTNLFIGILLVVLSIFIFFECFTSKAFIPPLSVLYLLLITFVLKLIAIMIMHKIGKKIHSNTLIVSVEESKTDLYSTIGVMIVTILLQFSKNIAILKYSDKIEHYDKVASFLEAYKKIKDYDIDLIQYGSYFKLQLTLELDDELNLRQVTRFVNKLKKDIKRHRSLNIKYITIYVTDKLENKL